MTLDDIRGKGSKGQGRRGDLKVDPALWGLFLPANSTLRNYLPPVNAYEGLNLSKLGGIKKAFGGGNVIVSFDEIEIQKVPPVCIIWICLFVLIFSKTLIQVLFFNTSTLEAIGSTKGPIPEKDARKKDWNNIHEELADKVTQPVFLSWFPYCYFPVSFTFLLLEKGPSILRRFIGFSQNESPWICSHEKPKRRKGLGHFEAADPRVRIFFLITTHL